MKKSHFSILTALVILFHVTHTFADQTVISHKVEIEPVIDGIAELNWTYITPTTTFDPIANHEIMIKSVHTDKKIFFLVTFPDKDESRRHRAWHWNNKNKTYVQGNEREDIFLFKWAISEATTDLTLTSDTPYIADLWFWKARRTDPTYFADDKLQRLLYKKERKGLALTSKSGNVLFLRRQGDSGKSAYKTSLYTEYIGDVVTRYTLRQPLGSRADVKAKGIWDNGSWTIEFARKLNTGSKDDVDFSDFSRSYLFGLSRFELSGGVPEPEIEQPLYMAGEITEHLRLKIK
ncbi:MAG: ethylbenzene dehydrogenase-related protein [Desulfotalea sp.]